MSKENQSLEIEIKSLLGSKENAENLKKNLMKRDPDLKLVGKGKQLNHYFNAPEDFSRLNSAVSPLVEQDKLPLLKKVIEGGKKVSIRSRDSDGRVSFIIKASLNDHTSANGVSRIEFESPVKLSLDELDKVLLGAGLTYQAKWSREREEYRSGDTNICIDKNAGYGYLAEFERMVENESMIDEVKKGLESFMKEMGVSELPQERIERMFAHYNAHWPEYYGTEKVFNIE